MSKVVLPTIDSGFLSVDVMNDALRTIEEGFDNTLSLDGTTPNQLNADLDLNGHALLNIATTGESGSLLTYGQMTSYVDGKASGLIRQLIEVFTAAAGQTVFTFATFTYKPDTGNLAVYKNGVRLFSPTNYLETSPTTITLTVPALLGDKIQVVSSEFLATAELPPHTHPFSQITDVPVYATRWPAWGEVTGKPTEFTPTTHQHTVSQIIYGLGPSFSDPIRGVYVQSVQPTPSRVGDLWFW